MFSFFKKQKPYEQEARALYASAMEASRNPEFYTHLEVPDTMDGRFDLLLLHIFFILNRILSDQSEEDPLAQAIFDVCFEDMDQALRECGIGDTGIGRHMKRMMLAFNGRMHAYDAALKSGDKTALKDALRRNLYGTCDDVREDALEAVSAYVTGSVQSLTRQSLDSIRSGQVIFTTPKTKVVK